MNKKICPIMSKGWLANSTIDAHHLEIKQLPYCVKEKCACWIRVQNLVEGHCGLIGDKNVCNC